MGQLARCRAVDTNPHAVPLGVGREPESASQTLRRTGVDPTRPRREMNTTIDMEHERPLAGPGVTVHIIAHFSLLE